MSVQCAGEVCWCSALVWMLLLSYVEVLRGFSTFLSTFFPQSVFEVVRKQCEDFYEVEVFCRKQLRL